MCPSINSVTVAIWDVISPTHVYACYTCSSVAPSGMLSFWNCKLKVNFESFLENVRNSSQKLASEKGQSTN